MSVSLITFCHPPRYSSRLHEPGILRQMVESHKFAFDEVIVIHNQCRAADYPPFDYPCRTVDLPRAEFEPLMIRWKVDPYNQRFHELTHGEGAAHWYAVHTVNHLYGLENTTAEYIVFADCDTRIKSQPPNESWIDHGIRLLNLRQDVLIVSPGDGAENGGPGEGGRILDNVRLTRNVSQQLFLCRSDEFRGTVDFDVPWNGLFDGPGGPMGEWYAMLEGRLGRYMQERSGQWRAVLPDRYRYWHNGKFATDREEEGWLR